MRNNYGFKKTISVRQFISELGDGFSKHMKTRLSELGSRCVLTRKDNKYRLDLKHVEHIKNDCDSCSTDKTGQCQKEYSYAQFVLNEGMLYFSESCLENDDVMQAPVVDAVYKTLNSEDILIDEDIRAKKVNDTNIDYVVNSILEVCPPTSPEHMAIISKYRNK